MINEQSKVVKIIQKYARVDAPDALKLLLAAATFFCMIGAYSILRSLKTSIFLGFVGREYEPIAKILAIVLAVPAMLIHARITDSFRRHQVVYCFIGFYAVSILIFSILFLHPVYGISNTQTSPYRILGWVFEFLMDLFQALVVGTFWSFLNSISTPAFAEKGYGFIVAGSRIGGILTPLLSLIVLEKTALASSIAIPLLTASAALLLILAIYCIYVIQHSVPTDHLHGYEAGHKEELQGKKKKHHPTALEGLRLILTQPYVFGIFGLVFSYEVVNIIFDYQMHVAMSISTNNQIGAMSSFMLVYTCSFQVLSFIFALFGTSAILKHLGVKWSLLVMPGVTLLLTLLPVMYPKLWTFFFVMVVLRALNYGFNHPLREILFIPTVKDIQFKSKAWIESFGRTFSKTTGSTLNWMFGSLAPYFCIMVGASASAGITVIWAFMALLVGKKYLTTIAANQVIGKRTHTP